MHLTQPKILQLAYNTPVAADFKEKNIAIVTDSSSTGWDFYDWVKCIPHLKEYVLLLKIGKTNYRFNCVLENYLTTCYRGISVSHIWLCELICLSIGIHALIKQEIPVTKTRIWKGKSTLFLAIPLIAIPLIFEGILIFMFSKSKIESHSTLINNPTQPDKQYQSYRELFYEHNW